MSAGRTVNSQSQDWNTPPKYVKPINEMFNYCIDLDPCSNECSLIQSKRKYILPENGLELPWNFHNIYVNPPYGRNKENSTTIKNWIKRCFDAHEINKSEVLALIPVVTNTQHWKKYVFHQNTSICFLYDTRLKFYYKNQEVKKGAPMACAMIYWETIMKNLKKFLINMVLF